MDKNDLIENVDMAEENRKDAVKTELKEDITVEGVDSGTEKEAVTADSGIKEVPPENKKFTDLFKVLWFDLGALIVLVFVVLMIVLMLPKNRLSRNLSKAESLFAAGNYQGAATKYLKAEAASNNSFKAKIGHVYALAACNTEDMENVFISEAKNALELGAVKDEEMSYMAEFYLMAPEYITKDLNTLIEILEAAYEKYELEDFKAPIADAYYRLGQTEENSDFEAALSCYEKTLEFSEDASEYSMSIATAVNKYVDNLKKLDEYEKAYEVCEKYSGLTYFDYETVKENVARSEALYQSKVKLLGDVKEKLGWYYDANKPLFSKEYIEGQEGPLFGMMDADFSEMLLLDGSKEADELANSFSQVSYLSKEALDGVGAALFTYGEAYTDEEGNTCSGYYFYYGEFKEGKKNGYGISIVKTDIASYKAYEGFWENDMPNGFGVYYENNMYAHTSLAEYRSVTFGEYKEGKMNGDMTEHAVLNEYPDTYFVGSFTATDGDVPAVSGDLMEYGIVDPLPEGTYLVGRLQSVSDGYDYFISLYKKEGELFKVEGF